MARGFTTFTAAVDAWYATISSYDLSHPGPQASAPKAALFANIVWRTTTGVGCAVNRGCTRPFYVCIYLPSATSNPQAWAANVRPAIAAVAKPEQPPTGEPLSALDAHNALRARHGAAPLRWDAGLAASAGAWAAECSGGLSGAEGVGESIARGDASFAAVVEGWYDEMKLYDFSRPGWRASAGRFTQLVWRDTTTVGCAVAAGCPSKTFVCRYSPPGNVIGGDWATEVPRPLTKSEVAAAARAQSEDAQPPPEPVADITLNGRSKRPAAGPVVAAVPAVAPRRCDDAAAAARLALDRTNVYRTMHQVAPVTWDDDLAANAAAVADGCGGSPGSSKAYGENVARGYDLSDFGAAVDKWYSEVVQYDFSDPGWNADAGHFTQLVWKDSSRMGCAVNLRCTWPVYVCQYIRPGNVIGADWAQQVLPAVAPTPAASAAIEEWQPAAATSPAPAAAAALVPAPAPAGAAGKRKRTTLPPTAAVVVNLMDPEVKAAFDLQNEMRAAHGAPALAWDASLANDAMSWLAGCPMTKSKAWKDRGENMAWGYPEFKDGIKAWYSEIKRYNFKHPGYSARAAHATQLLWHDTQRVGCAVTTNCKIKTYICQYQPQGNIKKGAGLPQLWAHEVFPLGTPADSSGGGGGGGARNPPVSPPLSPEVPPNGAGSGGNSGGGTSTPSGPAAPPSSTPGPAAPPQVTPIPGGGGNSQIPILGPDNGSNHEEDDPTPDPLASGAGGGVDAATARQLLDQQNGYRARHGVENLKWDAGLAASAAAFAAGCPLGHSGTRGIGENIAWGNPDWRAAIQAWYDEVQYVDWSNLGWRESTGHFTQLVWRDTTAVGCALNAQCPQPTYICQYAPAGNILGQDWTQHVFPVGGYRAGGAGSAGAGAGGAAGGGGAATGGSAPPSPPSSPPSTAGGGSGDGNVVDSSGAGSGGSGGSSGAPAGLSADLAAVLQRHNELRARHGAAPLSWDAPLAAQAQGYADGCPNGHSGMSGVGENLAWGYSSFEEAVNAWYNEVSSYDYNAATFSGATGHFTQVVWKGTTKLGCGSNPSCGMKTYVCQYTPPGNVMGEFADNVGRPT
ncbi:Protein PRY1 [Monoraphidium neglectum]|uniref:Protein PRY1 n=1 Tax=Monoraphidium neglectum TaxID=145388 RepID=A0A0D2M959_9CHLO|nr:Protein PRY1 [Monoraphidium neglectum]KIY97556.1 Protein PRY1 [Monoraphidium neglectum]|eukprot:XP_013896576.1 Protein PRY1 [Monoraphidium neglectum]